MAVEPWSVDAARWRLDGLRDQLPVPVDADAVFTGGASNDVWLLGDTVLRVAWRADRGRLTREARLLAALPDHIPHAPVVAAGRTETVSWMLAERVPGRPLDTLVDSAPASELREVFAELAQTLAALHAWTPPDDVARLLAERPDMRLAEPLSVWAADLVPLPVERAFAVADLARALPYVDELLVNAALARMADLATADPYAFPPSPLSVVHGDATPGNVLVHQGHLSALLDFEWVRLGPPDLELVSLVRMVQPEPGSGPPLHRLPVLRWLQEDYPALFAHPDLDARLWLTELGYILRGCVSWPPDRPEAILTPQHHVHTLRRLVEAPWPWRPA